MPRSTACGPAAPTIRPKPCSAHDNRRRRHAGARQPHQDIKAGLGGSGQYGNAINAFRAGNVIVRGNRIRNCDYSPERGNSASNIQISGNSVSDVREVALYSEFSFEGAVIANNTVDGAAPPRFAQVVIGTNAVRR
jgi:putative cofactor-binding repeat protein